MEQLTIYDAVTPVPQLWDCRKTCRRFGEKVDHPDWWPENEDRCMLCGTNEIRNEMFDNRAFLWCTLYEERRPEA